MDSSFPPPLPPKSNGPDSRQWITILHLSALAGLVIVGFGHILGPLIVWLLKRNDVAGLDAEFAPLWRARADCAAVRGTRDDAAIQRAFLLDPDDISTAIAAAEALLRGGEAAVGSALLRDLSVRFPASLAVLRAAAEQA
ncbi:MAG: DUF4870 domain-containing protein, partial [Alphaproteobacteria bacterium]|nr:DUF4870 domain-containing protein [Alphaproteobacteria bacterium]